MGRSSKALTALTSNLLDGFSGKLTTEMEHVVLEIDKLLTDHQAAGMHLTPEQQSANIDAGNLLLHLFEQIYTADQLRTTQRFYQMYPEREDLQALTNQCAEEAYTARALAMEVQEIRGNKRPGAGRTHAAPKGLKQQVQDVLEFQKRFIARSEKLWLEDNGVYDAIVNSPPQKRSEAIHNFLQEIRENFDKMQDLISTHIALCEKAQAAICEDEDSDVEPVSRKVAGSKMTRHK